MYECNFWEMFGTVERSLGTGAKSDETKFLSLYEFRMQFKVGGFRALKVTVENPISIQR